MAEARTDLDPNDGRPETASQRYDRNWEEMLQELRVTQTGTQIMSGFLLPLPFQQRFGSIHPYELVIYVVLVVLAASATALGFAPVALHRMLFRRHQKREMVTIADRLLQAVLVLVSALTAGVVLFVLDFTVSFTAGIIAGAAVLVLLIVLLVVIPRAVLANRRRA